MIKGINRSDSPIPVMNPETYRAKQPVVFTVIKEPDLY